MPDENVYRQLQCHLDRMPVGFPATESGVEIRILQQLFTPQEALVALALSAVPETADKIHRRLKTAPGVDALRGILDVMAERGLIERHGARYGKSMFVVGIYERQVDRLTEELERDILQYFHEGFASAVHSNKTPQLRTIPVNRSIVPERGIAQYDDINELVRQSEGPFAVMNCVCRQGNDLVGSPCRQTAARESCLTLGPAAKEMMRRGVARLLDRDETLEVLERANDDGLVLQPQNTRNPLFVCCCCGCCCGVLTTAKRFPRPAEFFSANYYADVDTELCEACGICEQRCQMEAVAFDDGPAAVDVLRCIGCGLCISSCPSGAMQLKAKDHQVAPPKDTMSLYGRIFHERYGPWETLKTVSRGVLGLQV
jgi:electron transport complex protein RnfB